MHSPLVVSLVTMKKFVLSFLLAAFADLLFAAAPVVENGDFEDRSKFGRPDKNTEIGEGLGFNGNAGCRMRPTKGREKFRTNFPIKGQLVQGRKYRLTGYLKWGGDKTGCALVWESFRDGKEYACSWGSSKTPVGGGWYKFENVFTVKKPVDPNDSNRIMVWTSFNGKKSDPITDEDCIQVDNLTFEEAAPDWFFSHSWPTHHRVNCEAARVRCVTRFRGEFLKDGEKGDYALVLRSADRELARRSVVPDANGVMTVDFGKLDFAGAAQLVLELSVGGKLRDSRAIDVTVGPRYRPKPGEVEILENGVAMVDGKPFMPLGFYAFFAKEKQYPGDELEKHLKRLHDAGFNCVIDYATYMLTTEEARQRYYGLCQKYGIRVFADNFAGDGLQVKPHDEASLGKIGGRAKGLLKYPAILGWYTMDEASEDKIPNLCRVRRALNEASPGQVTVPCDIMDPVAYMEVGDVQSGDIYPIGQEPDLKGMDRKVEVMMGLAPAAAWHAPQCYNWANKNRDALVNADLYRKCRREGNENELLSVALLYAAHGVSGFFFYSYFDMLKTPVPGWPEKRWEYMKSIAKTFRSLEPFITSGIKPVRVAHTDVKGEHRIVALSDGKGAYRVLVIGLRNDNEATFALPAAYGKLKSRCGMTEVKDGTYVFRGREFSCDVLE